jgi:hypothetical protein
MKHQTILIVFCLLFINTACTVSPTVRSSYHQTTDFNQYKTFNFFENLDTDARYESLISQYLKQATIVEMTSRGYVLSRDQPDLLINFHNHIETKQTMHQLPTLGYGGGFYGYQGGFYNGPWMNDRTFFREYEQSTLTIDIVDEQLNKMIWQGKAVRRLTETKLDNLQTTLQQTISEILAVFPSNIKPQKND